MRSGWVFRSSITPLLDGRLLHGSRHTYGASVFGMCQQPKIGKSGAIKRTPRFPLSLASVTVPVVPFSTIASWSNSAWQSGSFPFCSANGVLRPVTKQSGVNSTRCGAQAPKSNA